MFKRMIAALIVMAGLVGLLGFVKYRQIQTAIAQSSSFQPPPEAVTTVLARQEAWRPAVEVIGTVTPVNGVTVSADLPGVVESIAFESGRRVRAGDLLVQLDTRQERAQLAAAKARRDLARLSLERIEGLVSKGVASRAELDSAASRKDESEASVEEIDAAIARKTIRAPFAGILGIRQVNRGQYLESGSPIVSLQSIDPIHVDFGVPQQELGRVGVGRRVVLSADDLPGKELAGAVSAVDSVVDPATRNVKIQATVANADGALRPGMFVNVKVELDEGEPVVVLPGSAIAYAPYGDSIFVVEELKGPGGDPYRGVTQRFVTLGPSRGDLVSVLTGVSAGEEVVTTGVFKLRNGAAVVVHNEIQPGSDPSPRPEDN